MQTLDLLHGTQTYTVDLSRVPFLSRLGPNEGELNVICDVQGRIIDLQVSLFSSRRVLLRELDRIAAETDWEVPVDPILKTTTPRFVVDLSLRQDAAARLIEAEIAMDDSSIEGVIQQLRPLLKDKHYTVSSLREVIQPQ